MAHHPYSFSNPAGTTGTRAQRPSHVIDERARVWDSEAPATAHDWDLERKESRAPLFIAGAASVVILGGLLLFANAATGDPPLAATLETETIPRQAALSEMLDAQALDRARVVVRGLAPASETTSAPVQVETTSPESSSTESRAVGASGLESSIESGAPMSVDPRVDPPMPTRSDESPTTPAPGTTTNSPVLLDRDNPYTTEIESPVAPSDSQAPARQPGAESSDNPY